MVLLCALLDFCYICYISINPIKDMQNNSEHAHEESHEQNDPPQQPGEENQSEEQVVDFPITVSLENGEKEREGGYLQQGENEEEVHIDAEEGEYTQQDNQNLADEHNEGVQEQNQEENNEEEQVQENEIGNEQVDSGVYETLYEAGESNYYQSQPQQDEEEQAQQHQQLQSEGEFVEEKIQFEQHSQSEISHVYAEQEIIEEWRDEEVQLGHNQAPIQDYIPKNEDYNFIGINDYEEESIQSRPKIDPSSHSVQPNHETRRQSEHIQHETKSIKSQLQSSKNEFKSTKSYVRTEKIVIRSNPQNNHEQKVSKSEVPKKTSQKSTISQKQAPKAPSVIKQAEKKVTQSKNIEEKPSQSKKLAHTVNDKTLPEEKPKESNFKKDKATPPPTTLTQSAQATSKTQKVQKTTIQQTINNPKQASTTVPKQVKPQESNLPRTQQLPDPKKEDNLLLLRNQKEAQRQSEAQSKKKQQQKRQKQLRIQHEKKMRQQRERQQKQAQSKEEERMLYEKMQRERREREKQRLQKQKIQREQQLERQRIERQRQIQQKREAQLKRQAELNRQAQLKRQAQLRKQAEQRREAELSRQEINKESQLKEQVPSQLKVAKKKKKKKAKKHVEGEAIAQSNPNQNEQLRQPSQAAFIAASHNSNPDNDDARSSRHSIVRSERSHASGIQPSEPSRPDNRNIVTEIMNSEPLVLGVNQRNVVPLTSQLVVLEAEKERVGTTYKMFLKYNYEYERAVSNYKRIVRNVCVELETKKHNKRPLQATLQEYFQDFGKLCREFNERCYKIEADSEVISPTKNPFANIRLELKKGFDEMVYLRKSIANNANRLFAYVNNIVLPQLKRAFENYYSVIAQEEGKQLQRREEHARREKQLSRVIAQAEKNFDRGLEGKFKDDLFVQITRFINQEKLHRVALRNFGRGLLDLRRTYIRSEKDLFDRLQQIVGKFKVQSSSVYCLGGREFWGMMDLSGNIKEGTRFADLCTLVDLDYIKYVLELQSKQERREFKSADFQNYLDLVFFDRVVGNIRDTLKGATNKVFPLQAEGEELVHSISGNMVLFNRPHDQTKDQFVIRNLNAKIIGSGFVEFDQLQKGIFFDDSRTIRLKLRDDDRAEELICYLNEKEEDILLTPNPQQ